VLTQHVYLKYRLKNPSKSRMNLGGAIFIL